MGEHALLSASGAHKWLPCPPSAKLEATLPESESDYAKEGQLAHAIAELKLRKAFTEPMGLRAFNNRLKKLQENPLYQDEMMRHTDTYVDYISQIVHSYCTPPYVAIEKKLNYSSFAPEGFGTGDTILISGNTLYVIDLKYGKGVPVSAFENPQMMLYALGAFCEYSFLYPIDTVKMAVVQPRLLDSPSVYELTAEKLLAWGESIKPIAQQAFMGEGVFASGEHCRFCRAKAQCRARSEFNIALEEYKQMKPPLISNEEVGQILQKAEDLAAWAKHLKAYALSECIKGNEIPGWKAVEGKSNRQFSNLDEAFKVLIANGTEEAMLYVKEPLTLTAVEELLGKAKFKELLATYVNKPPGAPTLAPLSDKREPIKRTSAAEDFKDNTVPNVPDVPNVLNVINE
jgi:hypothetical protein